MSNSIALKPRLSEKAYSLSQELNTYTFEVPKSATKQSVSHEVALQFKVTVTSVRLAKVPGKSKRTYRRGGRRVQRGQRSDVKKAYVTLAEGDVLPIFAATDEDKGKAGNPSTKAQGKGGK